MESLAVGARAKAGLRVTPDEHWALGLAVSSPTFGIYGHSGGGFASTDAILRFPDFYKVAVSTAGNHDNRTYHAAYAEKYQGLMVRDTVAGTDNYANQVNASLAGQLKGKLFLMTGP